MSGDVGLIVGSGLTALAPRIVASESVATPYGTPSSRVLTVEIAC